MAFDPRWKNPPGPDVQQLYRWAQDLITELRRGAYFDQAAGGFVSGPALSTDSGFAKWDGTTGRLLKDSNATIEEAELANDAVTYAKLQNISAQFRALGLNSQAGPANAEEVTLSQLLDWIGSAAQGDILYRGASSWARLPAGTSGNFLQTQGAGADPQWAGVTAPGMVLLASGTVTNQATLDLVLTGYTAYRALKFVLSSFVPVTDDRDLRMQFSTDGGSSYVATNYAFTLFGAFDNATNTPFANAGTATAIVIAGDDGANQAVSNVANEGGVDVEVTLYDQTAARFTRARIDASMMTADNGLFRQIGAGQQETAQDTDAVRFFFENVGGNPTDIASGKWALYGYA